MRRRRRLLKVILVLGIVLVLATGTNYALYLSALKRRPAPGVIVQVDGTDVHLDCTGAGSTTVVFESSLGGWSVEWHAVREQLASEPDLQLCAYDRSGLGWSESLGRPVPSTEVAARLRAALMEAGVPGPYILVGFSLGGIFVREFAHQYPDDVAGLVLVDPAHDEMLRRLPPAEVAGTKNGIRLLRYARFLAPLGVGRLIRQPVATGPSTVQDIKTTIGYRPASYFAYYNEVRQFVEESTGTRELPAIPPVPVALLEATETLARPGGAGEEWKQMYAELAAQSPRTTVTIVEGDHFIPIHHPARVADAVRDIRSQVLEMG